MCLLCSFLRHQVQGEVRQGERQGSMPLLLRRVLQGLQLRALRHLRQQGRVPLLQGQGHLRSEEEAQVPMNTPPPPLTGALLSRLSSSSSLLGPLLSQQKK